MTGKLTRLVSDFAEKVDRSFGWARLPTIAAIPVLIGLRDRLRAKNLYDTGRGPLDKPPFEDPDVNKGRCHSASTHWFVCPTRSFCSQLN